MVCAGPLRTQQCLMAAWDSAAQATTSPGICPQGSVPELGWQPLLLPSLLLEMSRQKMKAEAGALTLGFPLGKKKKNPWSYCERVVHI